MTQTVYSPAVNTYTALQTITLGFGASSVTFASIPATYRDLVLVGTIGLSAQNSVLARANSDSGSNYSEVFAWGNGSTTTSGSSSSLTGFPIRFADTSLWAFQASFMDYSATDKHTTCLVRHGNATYTMMSASRWANTNAITSLTIVPAARTFNIGTTLSLYGIAS